MKNLAEFKRYLATPGACVRLVSINGHPPRPELAEWRTVAVLQTNAVAFTTANKSGKSWLHFSPAKDWTFDGNTASFQGLTYEIGGN